MGIELSKQAIDVGIVTTDLAEMRAFYVDALGFVPDEPSHHPGAGTILRLSVGESILRLLEVEAAPAHRSPEGLRDATGLRFLTLSVTDIDAAHLVCLEAGAVVSGAPYELAAGIWTFRSQDPDGNWIEFTARR
jgi:catechol 2,3-dioxygenase-like lactoylglutathione lyase family enzyme